MIRSLRPVLLIYMASLIVNWSVKVHQEDKEIKEMID
jgi:hypothetical protein